MIDEFGPVPLDPVEKALPISVPRNSRPGRRFHQDARRLDEFLDHAQDHPRLAGEMAMWLDRRRCLLIGASAVLAGPGNAGPAPSAPSTPATRYAGGGHRFRLLYPTLRPSIPDELRMAGVEPCLYLPHFAFFKKAIPTDHVQLEHIRETSRGFMRSMASEQGSSLITINIEAEHWRWHDRTPPADRRKALARLATVVQTIKEELPHKDLAVYNLPWSPFYRSFKYRDDMAAWRRRLEIMKEPAEVIAELACTGPSVYCFFKNDWDIWKGWATETVAACKEFHPDVPCYPWVWAMFHPAGDAKGEPLPPGMFLDVLETVRRAGADGAFLWRSGVEGKRGWMREVAAFAERLSGG